MNKKVSILGWATLLGFGLAGLSLVYFFQQTSLVALFVGHWSIPNQLFAGLLSGITGAFISLKIINAPFFRKEKQKYNALINSWPWTIKGIIFISICAGVGEELLFRAGIQPFLGLWVTAFLFVFIHGYLNPWNWRISVYGTVMILFIALMGYLFEKAGILSAMVAHAVFDAILLYWIAVRKS
ncbi:CPBP family intramembrane glutamic endopeptidase [uncultured Cyclobacterium sp.]|uniref:CPBP family intramembrane glutamic endopeptidase n=1 Tax=uncultured Cyclobacterium sp. TaxID=453820 RepID=UPI0030EB9CE9|tara:strand:+ start:80356 stop:80904 length:549 start_codon:yes stop_codon:yes gene_type:complete